MKWWILVIALSICVELIIAKSSDKTYPKKVKNRKPTKGPKTILDEFSSLSEDDKEFIKELDKQFKMHGDVVKIKVERDNSTVKNPKRTVDSELGYGNQNSIAQQRFQFSKPTFQFFPYSQQTVPIPNGFNGANNGFYHSSVQIQPSRAYEIKETPGGYKTYTPNNQPFRPPFTPKPTIIPSSFSTGAFSSTKFPPTPAYSSTPTYSPAPYPSPTYPGFQPVQQQQKVFYQGQQQISEPVIVLRIPGPAKYAAHLQSLLQRYLEIRAAQYIKAFEEHEARVAQQQALFRQQHQHYPEAQPEAQHPLIQTTDYYKPATKFMVGAPLPTPALQPQFAPSPNPHIQHHQIYSAPVSPLQRPHLFPAHPIQQPKQLSIQYQQPQIPNYQVPKAQFQQFIVQQVPTIHGSLGQNVQQSSQEEEVVQIGGRGPQEYLAPKAQEQQVQPQQQPTQEYLQPQPQGKEYAEEDAQPAQEIVNIPAKQPSLTFSATQKPAEFSLTNILQNQFFAGKNGPANNLAKYSSQQPGAAENSEEVDDQPEIPEARHTPVYSDNPNAEGVHEDENHQLFSYDQQPQGPPPQQVQRPHKVYGPPNEQEESNLPITENSPRPTHTRIRFNDNGNSDDHSSVYPLPPIPSASSKFDYEKQQQSQAAYETVEQEGYGTEEPVLAITQKQRGNTFSGYNSHSLLNTDFQGDAPYTQSQFKKLNDLINRLKQRSPAILPAVSTQEPATNDD
ncbi:unnamed protein product [Hermetia illucens]|uniref:Uncharacterized protein n=1 Tax=Hermetia illucens TaxID=343691 RepID=A0A7R8UTJ7_HERIL|nr:mediator of RNA polymerase II transcription subunit 15 [Hermetia illucens]CAD7086756.1 unnamed protein product [Hermetia illucens]